VNRAYWFGRSKHRRGKFEGFHVVVVLGDDMSRYVAREEVFEDEVFSNFVTYVSVEDSVNLLRVTISTECVFDN
jgi:hypothetical protein